MNKNELIELISKNELEYHGNTHKIKYLFLPEEESDHLIVVFSGFHGYEVDGKPAVYNYINTLEDTKINKLFILDSVNNVPVYYLGIDNKESYLSDTSILIKEYVSKLNMDMSKVILAGSSKGGTGALMTGFNIQSGHIISAANQVYVGNYLKSLPKVRNLIFTKIFGDNKEENIERLNRIFEEKILINKTKSNLYFHGGTKDPHYMNHMKPMLKHFDKNKIYYELDLKNYKGHSSVIYYFPEYLKRKVNEIINLPTIQNASIILDVNAMIVRIKPNYYRSKTFSTKVDFVLEDNSISSSDFKKSLVHKIDVLPKEIKRIKVTLKEYDIIRDEKEVEVDTSIKERDFLKQEFLIPGEWIDVKGKVAKNSKMYRTGLLKYNSKKYSAISGSGYVSYYKGNKFLATKRYMGDKKDLPFELDSISEADNIVLSFNERWLNKIDLLRD